MKIKTITVSYGLTVNLGNFESMRLDEAQEIEIEEGDDPAQCKAKAYAVVKLSVLAQAAPQIEARGRKVESILQGLPEKFRAQIEAAANSAERANLHDPTGDPQGPPQWSDLGREPSEERRRRD